MHTTKYLHTLKHALTSSKRQLDILNDRAFSFNQRGTFVQHLRSEKLYPLTPTTLEIFQMNLGKMCNQVCTHCHVDAGPDRKEIMTKEVMQDCINAIKHTPTITTIDLTGGAPEMNPHFEWLIKELHALNKRIIVRSNLTILRANKKYYHYPQFFKDHKVTVVSSMPCYTADNVDKQRGNGVFKASIEALKELNKVGYGIEGSQLELNLVFNPGGPSLPPPQESLEHDYKTRLKDDFNIDFNHLYTITNIPISRFLDQLMIENRLDEYMNKLIDAFNIEAAKGVMCRNTLSISWDGKLFDCDFNQMLDYSLEEGTPSNIKDFNLTRLNRRAIQLDQHCFGCTAGSGSSCGGSLL